MRPDNPALRQAQGPEDLTPPFDKLRDREPGPCANPSVIEPVEMRSHNPPFDKLRDRRT
jgi:hypothetical protein